jgi:hypothetical protein
MLLCQCGANSLLSYPFFKCPLAAYIQYYLYPVYKARRKSRPKTIIDIDDGDTGRA